MPQPLWPRTKRTGEFCVTSKVLSLSGKEEQEKATPVNKSSMILGTALSLSLSLSLPLSLSLSLSLPLSLIRKQFKQMSELELVLFVPVLSV